MILLGWSYNPIGVDIENSNRKIFKDLLIDKYFSYAKEKLADFKDNNLKLKILDYWVINEAVIKLKKGNLFLDGKKWEFNENISKSFNKHTSEYINSKSFNVDSWTIGIANQNISNIYSPIICKL